MGSRRRQGRRTSVAKVVIPRLYTAAQVAAELGITGRRVRQLAKARGLGQKIGPRALVFTEAEVDSLRVRKTGRPRKDG